MSVTKGLDRPLAMYVTQLPSCFDRSDVHIRRSRVKFTVGKGIPYSTPKRPAEIERYEKKINFLPVPSEAPDSARGR
jgi:hypothetical protein